MTHCATSGVLQLISQRFPFTTLLHELNELAELIVDVVPELSELVTFDEVFELTDDDWLEFDWLELIELFAPPAVVALTVPDLDVIELEAACDETYAPDADMASTATVISVRRGAPLFEPGLSSMSSSVAWRPR